MATGATVFNFEINLSDINRHVYEALTLRVARHPSESLDYLLTRVLAYCLEYGEGLELTDGLSDPELPALRVRDLTGQITAWIEVGNPSAEKLHKASKSVERVAVYTYKDPAILLQQLDGKRLHRAESILLRAFQPGFLSQLATFIERRNVMEFSVNEDQLYVNIGGQTLSAALESRYLA